MCAPLHNPADRRLRLAYTLNPKLTAYTLCAQRFYQSLGNSLLTLFADSLALGAIAGLKI